MSQSPDVMSPDVIVVGSGAGGAAVAYKLVRRGMRVLMLERGGALPRDGSTISTREVFKNGTFKNKEPWLDGRGDRFMPDEYYNLGGKTKWYGAALLRFAAHEFEADTAHQCLAWPFGHAELAPYYAEAEAILHVNRFENEPELQQLVERICRQDRGWRNEALPLGLKPEILGHAEEAKHFDGYASVAGFKADAERNLIEPIAGAPGFTLMTGKKVSGFLYAASAPARIDGVRCDDGSEFRAGKVVLAAGAMSSPRLLQDHLAATGLDRMLPSAALVGANFKLHLNSALLAFSPFSHHDVLRKTAIFLNERYPHTTVQCLGWLDGEILATQISAAVPSIFSNAAGARAIGFFVTTEDGSCLANKVISGNGMTPTLDYDLRRLPPTTAEHEAAIADFRHRLLRAGLAGVDRYVGLAGTAHALGSLVTGDDPARSVVDPSGRVHGMDGLYVADGSVLPRSSRVNPALTIYAWGLRLGDQLDA